MNARTPPKEHNTALDVPENLVTFVEAIGVEATCKLVLALGGAAVYLADKPTNDNLVRQAVGEEAAIALCRHVGNGHVKIPLARQWTAAALNDMGWSPAKIARAVRADEVTVRRWLKKTRPQRHQLSLF